MNDRQWGAGVVVAWEGEWVVNSPEVRAASVFTTAWSVMEALDHGDGLMVKIDEGDGVELANTYVRVLNASDVNISSVFKIVGPWVKAERKREWR